MRVDRDKLSVALLVILAVGQRTMGTVPLGNDSAERKRLLPE